MFLVVLSTIFLNFKPLTAAMIVIMSLLDDIPIMTIAYDNTPVSEWPIRWNMPRVLGVASVLGLFSVVQSFGMLLIGMEALGDPPAEDIFGFMKPAELQTAMFLQLGRRRPSAALGHAHGALVPEKALSGASAVSGDRADADRGDFDVRLRLAGRAYFAEADRVGLVL